MARDYMLGRTISILLHQVYYVRIHRISNITSRSMWRIQRTHHGAQHCIALVGTMPHEFGTIMVPPHTHEIHLYDMTLWSLLDYACACVHRQQDFANAYQHCSLPSKLVSIMCDNKDGCNQPNRTSPPHVISMPAKVTLFLLGKTFWLPLYGPSSFHLD